MSTPNAPTVRPLRRDDRTGWSMLWRDYLAFYETTLPVAVYDATFDRLTDPANDAMNAFVAEQNGDLVGLVHYIFHDHCWKPEGVCYLQDLFVSPGTRGTGTGRSLIEAVYAAADTAGRPTVYWLTQSFNATARQLYDRVANETQFVKYQRP